MAFYIYDITLLILFSLAVGIFLFRNKKNLKKEMKIIFLYKTKVGLEIINYVGKKYKKTLEFLKYFSISIGYILMVGILFLIGRSVYLYLKYPAEIISAVKAPPIAPVIPYFPKLFGMETFFPPFYFIYFILALSIVAIVHEFAHGIYARLYNLKIKSTGILFLGPILGAFVEQDEKGMDKLSKIKQMSILSSGVFANIITAFIFLLIWMGIFYASFVPSGAIFNTYAMNLVDVDSIESINGVSVKGLGSNGIIDIIDENNLTDDLVLGVNGNTISFTKIVANGKDYFMTVDLLKEKLEMGDKYVNGESYILLYGDYPAINQGMKGTIVQIDNHKINSYDDLSIVLDNYHPNEEIKVKTNFEEEILEYNIILDERPDQINKAMLGVGNYMEDRGNIADSLAFFKDPFTEYKIKCEFLLFLYYLVFWIFFINLLVGFFNMLPVPLLDGGRFFYLTILGISKNEKTAKTIYRWTGLMILFAFTLMMLRWFFQIIK